MKRLLTLTVASCILALSSVAVAQDCSTLTGTTISPLSFDAAVAAVSSAAPPVKDEFETTAQFEARLAATGSNLPSNLLVSLPVDPEYLTYNADKGAFEVKPYAVANLGADWFTVFYGSPHYGTLEYSTLGNLAIVLSSEDESTGTYQGQNAYGATWEIVKIDRSMDIIFEGDPPRYGVSLFANTSTAAVPVWDLPVAVDQARGMKERIRAVAMIAPKAPYFFENSQPSAARITIQNPRDITQISRVLVADIQCVAFTDDANNVLLTIRTN